MPPSVYVQGEFIIFGGHCLTTREATQLMLLIGEARDAIDRRRDPAPVANVDVDDPFRREPADFVDADGTIRVGPLPLLPMRHDRDPRMYWYWENVTPDPPPAGGTTVPNGIVAAMEALRTPAGCGAVQYPVAVGGAEMPVADPPGEAAATDRGPWFTVFGPCSGVSQSPTGIKLRLPGEPAMFEIRDPAPTNVVADATGETWRDRAIRDPLF